MKIGDKVVLIDPDYRKITGEAVGTIVSEYISDSQWNMLHPVQQWNVEFENPEFNYHFLETALKVV